MKKRSNPVISIRTLVLSLFLIAFCLTAGLLSGVHFYFDRQIAENTAEKIFTATAEKIGEQLDILNNESRDLLRMLGQIQISPTAKGQLLSTQRALLIGLIKQNNRVHAIHSTDSDGNFFEVISLKNSEKYPDANPDDRWVTIHIEKRGDKRIKTTQFFDKNLTLRASADEATRDDPNNLLWYRMASEASGMVISPPYLFAHFTIPGVTFAKKFVATRTIIGIDISLEEIHTVINQKLLPPRSNTFIFNDKGDIITHKGIANKLIFEEKQEPVFLTPGEWPRHDKTSTTSRISLIKRQHQELIKLASENNQIGTIQRTHIEGKAYFTYVHLLKKMSGEHYFIGFLAPVADSIAPDMKKIYIALLATLGLLLLLIPGVWMLAGMIINPINALTKENAKITKKQYDDVGEVTSNITEIINLSHSMVSMASSLEEYATKQRDLLESFIKLIAAAIDKKSHCTGSHCKRVPVLSAMIARAASDMHTGPLAKFAFTGEDQWREFRIASWLHDCGKIITPEYIVDKGTKLEVIHNRIHEIRTRFEVLLRDAEIDYWKALAQGTSDQGTCLQTLQSTQKQLRDDFVFVAQCNIGSEFMGPENVARIKVVARRTWTRTLSDRLGLSHAELKRYPSAAPQLPCRERLLADRPEHIIERPLSEKATAQLSGFTMHMPEQLYNQGEIYNLCIPHGTLTPEDRYKINEHVISTIRMLEPLPFPEKLARIPEYAGAHHENLIGTGYPRGLKGDQISIPARILTLADVFEALTASDRPYKKAKKLSEAVKILSAMAQNGHIDPDLFRLFLSSGLYLRYAEKFLAPAQIDEVAVEHYLH
ncbi:MAG: hypothetical protein M0O96_08080 [Desulforhopalus sp.]|nr:hypothetical protein [Desulforhopalus sp.]